MQAMAGVRVHPALEPLFNLVIDLRTKSGEWREDMKPHITSHHITSQHMPPAVLTWSTHLVHARVCQTLVSNDHTLQYSTTVLHCATALQYCTVLLCTAWCTGDEAGAEELRRQLLKGRLQAAAAQGRPQAGGKAAGKAGGAGGASGNGKRGGSKARK